MVRATTKTPLKAVLAAVILLAAGFVIVTSYGGTIYHRVRDSDSLRGLGLESSSDGFREWTVDRLGRASRPVRADHLRLVWQLEREDKIDAHPSNGTALLALIAHRQPFPEELRQEIIAEFLRTPRGDRHDHRLTLAVGSLGRDATPVIEHLVTLLASEQSMLPQAAARSLGTIADLPRPVVERMARALGASDDLAVRTELVRAIGRASEHEPLGEDVLVVLEHIAMHDRNAHLRADAITALVAHPSDSERLLWVLREVPDRDRVTGTALHWLGPELRSIIDDTREPPEWRAAALRRWTQVNLDHPDLPRLVMGAVAQEHPALRAAGYEAFSLLQRAAFDLDPEWDAVMERGLTDHDPAVRAAAVREIPAIPVPESRRLEWLARARQDREHVVASAAARELRRMQPPEPPPDRTPVWVGQTFFSVLVAIPILICIGFSVYYTSRIVVYALARRWRALLAAGVLSAWLAISAGLGYAILMAVMGLGHSNVKGRESMIVLAVYLVAMMVYFAAGWLLRLGVRDGSRA